MKIAINSNTFVATSTIKVEDIKYLAKVKPDALKVADLDKDGNVIKEFAVAYRPGAPKVNAAGINFDGATHDENGFATISGSIPADKTTAEAAKDYVADYLGGALEYVNRLESSIGTETAALKAAREALLSTIAIS